MTAGRTSKGQFKKGVSGNPSGRPKREREERFLEITLSAVTFTDWKAIIKRAVGQAKRGNQQARKFLADYLIGPPVQRVDAQYSGDISMTITEWECQRQERLNEICGPE